MAQVELHLQGAPGGPLRTATTVVGGRLATPLVRPAPPAAAPGWAYACVAIQFLCQLALLIPVLAPARLVFRTAALGSSLLFLLVIRTRPRRRHAVEWWGLAALTVVSLSALNPGGGAPLAVLAHWGLYLAVIAPLFWSARLALDERTLGGLLICLWAFHFASSVAGVLQVSFPGRFQPALTTFINERQIMTIRLSSGEWVPRPMGLTDTPGGAGPSGFYATLFGVGVVLLRPFPLARTLGLASMVTGMICIYLAQVRVALVLLFLCFTVLVALLMLSGRISGLFGTLMLGAGVALVSFELAFAMGGDAMVARMQSLIESPPIAVYQANRGWMLEDAFLTRLPEYPLGAGLGHWGMMNAYFGSSEHEIGAELQWGGWVLDGGLPLIIAYFGAMLLALWAAARESLRATDPRRRCWVAVVAAFDVGIVALCFSYAPFMGTGGVQFWLLNGVVLATSTVVQRGRTPQQRTALQPVR